MDDLIKSTEWLEWSKFLSRLICKQYRLGIDHYESVDSEITMLILELLSRKPNLIEEKNLLFHNVFEKIHPRMIKMLNGFSNDVEYEYRNKREAPTLISASVQYLEEGEKVTNECEAVYGNIEGQDSLDFEDTMRQVDAELQKLPEVHRKALRMVWEGEKIEDVSKCLKIPLRTLKRKLQQFQVVMRGMREKGEI